MMAQVVTLGDFHTRGLLEEEAPAKKTWKQVTN